ncbi:uncharacterized protein MAM_00873 [Metarhizium album ARSEF 1941]|uniref:Uncharacterized protein n=1 Tax=Metarhizium album (strain ARSEF 1941) TaxID=1081103 RepID=A0A0B2X028_METAS|nr:uncharacterized protein MAM_00873 [Metarhizium album ARSEF 1941]KHO01872.1 hypothetical protein MAM_00873 [Metarhizium album ARSEF 1941]
MRIGQNLGALVAASVAIAASSGEPFIAQSTLISIETPLGRPTSIPAALESGTSLRLVPSANATTPFTTATSPATTPNTTTSHTAELTGGAIPQQMQASMAGLLGFCIMGLVML